jgi:hypothetical protein
MTEHVNSHEPRETQKKAIAYLMELKGEFVSRCAPWGEGHILVFEAAPEEECLEGSTVHLVSLDYKTPQECMEDFEILKKELDAEQVKGGINGQS